MFQIQPRKELNLVATVLNVVWMEHGIQGRSSHNMIAGTHFNRRQVRLHETRGWCWINLLSGFLNPRSVICNFLCDQMIGTRRGKDSRSDDRIWFWCLRRVDSCSMEWRPIYVRRQRRMHILSHPMPLDVHRVISLLGTAWKVKKRRTFRSFCNTSRFFWMDCSIVSTDNQKETAGLDTNKSASIFM